jgi:hypothetical protein
MRPEMPSMGIRHSAQRLTSLSLGEEKTKKKAIAMMVSRFS